MSQQIKVSDETYKRLKKMSAVLHWTQGYCVSYLLDIYEDGMISHEPETETTTDEPKESEK